MSTMPKIVRKGLLKDSYTIEPVEGFIRSEMEVGTARQRRIATATPTNVSFRLFLKREGFKVFEAWYKHTLQNGAAWFAMPINCGSGNVMTDVRFTEVYSSSLVGFDKFEVSCRVECRELPTMSASDLAGYLSDD